ncbi:MAG: condensation domain-containing protein, partial [Acidobacteriota bacterium]
MSDLANKIAGLSPEKRALLVRKLKAQQAAANVFPLSFAQERLWLLDRMSPGNPFYNITTALEIRGAPDLAALRTTLDEIDRRHESLRTTFLEIDGEPMQRIAQPAGAPFGV